MLLTVKIKDQEPEESKSHMIFNLENYIAKYALVECYIKKNSLIFLLRIIYIYIYDLFFCKYVCMLCIYMVCEKYLHH